MRRQVERIVSAKLDGSPGKVRYLAVVTIAPSDRFATASLLTSTYHAGRPSLLSWPLNLLLITSQLPCMCQDRTTVPCPTAISCCLEFCLNHRNRGAEKEETRVN